MTGGFPIYENEIEDIVVYRRQYDGKEILDLEVNGAMESMMYLDAEYRDDLIFPYMSHFSYAFAVNPDLKKTYLIGGGGFSYPRYYLSHYPEKSICVAEYSKAIVEVSERYFGLEELLGNPRFQLHVGDGFAFLQQEYDVIINDAFIGSQSEGRNEEVTKQIREHLSPKGIYIVNYVGAPKGWKAYLTRRYLKQLKRYFRYTKVIQAEDDRGMYEPQNLVIFASNEELL